jgi:hypothetical protein
MRYESAVSRAPQIIVVPLASGKGNNWFLTLFPILLIFPIGGCIEVLVQNDKNQSEKIRLCLQVRSTAARRPIAVHTSPLPPPYASAHRSGRAFLIGGCVGAGVLTRGRGSPLAAGRRFSASVCSACWSSVRTCRGVCVPSVFSAHAVDLVAVVFM